MSEHDTHTDRAVPEIAGWVLDALDPHEAGMFGEHLQSCAGCQAAVAELQPAARLLAAAAPAVQPPADLQERTLASVQRAAARQRVPRMRVWRGWNTGMLSLAAVATAAAAVIFVGLEVLHPHDTADAVTIPLHAPGATASSGQAVARHTASGWSIQLTVQGLKKLRGGRFYECWYAGPGRRPGQPDLIPAGTFFGGSSGSMQMWSAADPHVFTVMQITTQDPGTALQQGKIILTGTPRL